MFISNAEKYAINLKLLDIDKKVNAHIATFQQDIAALREENAALARQLDRALTVGIPVKKDTTKYYWRKKAERLANGSQEKIYKPRKKKEKNDSENANNTSI